MTYNGLKKIIKAIEEFQYCIYVCNWFTRSYEKTCNTRILLCRNVKGKYVVLKFTDAECFRYSDRQIFTDKDLAADYAWKLFGGNTEYKKFLNKINNQQTS